MFLPELLLSKNEIQGQEKMSKYGTILGILGGKYGEMPCNLHQIRGDGKELLLSKNKIQGQEKIQNMGPYTGFDEP